MSRTRVIAARLRALFGGTRRDRDLDEEVQFHLDMRIEEHRRRGMNSIEARQAALRDFGAVEGMKDTYRNRRTFMALPTIARDARFGFRTLRRNPAFTIPAVATLALAIGAGIVMFAVLNAVLLQPLPYHTPGQLVMLWRDQPKENLHEGRSSYWTVQAWQQRSRSFADIAMFDGASVTLTDSQGAQKISAARVSPNLLTLLGVHLSRGRGFSAKEAERRAPLVLISNRFWHARFGGSDDALGASIELDGTPSEIIGILPPESETPGFDADVWEPDTMSPDWGRDSATQSAGPWYAIGRLRSAVTLDRAQAEMTTIARTLDQQRSRADRGVGIRLMPFTQYLLGARSRLALWLLAGAVLCLMLIAVANVASLSLARGLSRGRELAVRAALGAGPGRILQQLLAEGMTLSAVAGALGILLAWTAMRVIRAIGPHDLTRLAHANLGAASIMWAFGISAAVGILIGLAPAVSCWRRDPGASEMGARSTAGSGPRRLRRALTVAEFALAVMLMVSASLLIRSWLKIVRVDPGFRPARVLSLQLSTTTFQASSQRIHFYEDALAQIEGLPGVEHAGIIGDLFVSSDSEANLTAEGERRNTSERLRFRRDEISEDLFLTIGVPLLRGRFFSFRDGPDTPRVAIVNETMARRLWPRQNPIGRRFKLGPPDGAAPWLTVVGLVGDMRRGGPASDPLPQMFVPLAQDPSRLETLLVHTSSDDARQLLTSITAAVRRVNRQVPIYGVTTLQDRLNTYLQPRRFQTSLVMIFSLLALVMAVIGIYGLIQYSVVARTQEIGIRMVLGAPSSRIFRMVIGEGLALSLTGLALGLAGAYGSARFVQGVLFGVRGTDPATFGTVSLMLIAITLAACWLPARRATAIDPNIALRQE